MRKPTSILLTLLFAMAFTASANPVIYKAGKPAKGKKLVFIASDHEYRSEEHLPALARILAKRHGLQNAEMQALIWIAQRGSAN